MMRRQYGLVILFRLWHRIIKVFSFCPLCLHFYIQAQQPREANLSFILTCIGYGFLSGKMQHSLWTAEVMNSNLEAVDSVLPDVMLSKKFFFRRIWQGKGAQTAASEVTHFICISMMSFNTGLDVLLSSIPLCNAFSCIHKLKSTFY